MQFNNSASTKSENKNMTTLDLRKSISRSPLRLAFILIPLALAWFALLPQARAVCQDARFDFVNTVQVAPCAPPPAGIVAWWPAEGNAIDIIGGNNGMLRNSATFGTGEVRRAFSFNGVDQYVAIPMVVNNWPEGTIEGWINYVNPNVGGPQGSFIFAATIGTPLVGGGDVTDLGINPVLGNGTDLGFGIYDTEGWHWAASGITPTAGQWYHVAGTWGSVGVKIYINGVLTGSDPYNGPSGAVNFNVIGASSWPGSSVNAYVDELSIYSRALSDAEIQSIYNADGAGKCPPARPTPVPRARPTPAPRPSP